MKAIRRWCVAGAVVLALAGCSSSSEKVTDATPESTVATPIASTEVLPDTTTAPSTAPASDSTATIVAGRTETLDVDGRTFTVNVPPGYDQSTPGALIVGLHGYTANGLGAKEFFGLESLAGERRFLTVYPDGTRDTQGNTFWNATDACCKLTSADTDDSAFLTALIDRVSKTFSVDAKRVYFIGHSNGGFMSYRMACEHADRIAAIVSVAGATFSDVATCAPSQPVSVVQVHGTADGVIAFTGGSILANAYPAARTTVTTWAAYNGCNALSSFGGGSRMLDLDDAVAGDETTAWEVDGCKPGGAVELWTIDGGAHSPKLTAEFASSVVDFFLAHPKP